MEKLAVVNTGDTRDYDYDRSGRYEYLDAVTLGAYKDREEFAVVIDTEAMTATASSGCYEKDRLRVYYKFTATPDSLSEEEAHKVLEAGYGKNYDKEYDTLSLIEIFMQGDYVEVVKEESLGDCHGDCASCR